MTEKAVNEEQAVETDVAAEEEETPSVSLDDIGAAWDREHAESDEPEVEQVADDSDEEPEPEPAEPEPVEEELDHGEKSRLGRKVKRLEDTLSERDKFIDELRSGIDRLTGQIEMLSGNRELEQEEDGDPERIVTYGDLERFNRQQREAEERRLAAEDAARRGYEREYLQKLNDLEDTEPDYAQIYELLTGDNTEFNRATTNNPVVDFELNYSKAKLHLLQSEKSSKPKPKLKQEKAEGTRVGDTDKVRGKDPKSVAINELSQDAQDFLKRMRSRGEDPQSLADRALGEKPR